MKTCIRYIWRVIKYAVTTIIGFIGAFTQVICGFLSFITFIIILGGIIGSMVYLKVRPEFEKARAVAFDKLANMDETDFTMLSDTEVYDKDNNLVGLISAGHYEYADITDISEYITNGYIAVEDRRYKQHAGVDYVSIMRAFVALVRNDGEITQGGSTITQQVVKNTMLSQEQTFTRKMVEVMIAPYIDQRYGKDKVLEFYCNTNFYGNRCYGVQAASRYYFGKDVADLEVWEAAMLVGLSNSPATYDPVKHPEKALEKRNRVLDTMLKEGYIEESVCANAKQQKLNIVQEYAEGTKESYQSSYAIHCTALELMKNDGFEFKYTFTDKADHASYRDKYNDVYKEKSEEIRGGGYKIYTTLDSSIQNIAQAKIDGELSRFKEVQDESGRFALQGAAVVVDNQTNNVVAIVGGRGTEDAFNRGYQAVRQPGSTIKPILDYAPAFDTGEFTPSTIMNDYKWENGPSNSGSYHGNVTMREALNRSLNTVAWQVLQKIGINKGLEYLDKMQFMNLSYADNEAEAISIGGFTNGTRVVDMAKAYSTLANDGVYNDKNCITSIKYKENEIYKNSNKSTNVYSEDTAFMVTDILKGTMDETYGTGRGLDIKGQQAAGKTGTTNSNKDAWFCGYTKYYTTAVWMGYDTPKEMKGVYGATYAGKIWQDIMSDIHEGLTELDWEQPGTIYKANYDNNGVETENETGMSDYFSATAKVKSEETQKKRELKQIYDVANTKVKEYENWFINNIEDTYLVNQKYQEIKIVVSLISDDEQRKELMERVETKSEELNINLGEWGTAIAEYETNKIKLAEEKKAEEAKKSEENRVRIEKEQKIKSFETSIAELESMKYKDDRSYINITDKINEKIEKCREYTEYSKLAEEFNSAINKYNKLTTYEEWQVSERMRVEQEALKKAEEDKRKADEEKALQDKLSNELNSETESNYGPENSIVETTEAAKGPGMTP